MPRTMDAQSPGALDPWRQNCGGEATEAKPQIQGYGLRARAMELKNLDLTLSWSRCRARAIELELQNRSYQVVES